MGLWSYCLADVGYLDAWGYYYFLGVVGYSEALELLFRLF